MDTDFKNNLENEKKWEEVLHFKKKIKYIAPLLAIYDLQSQTSRNT